MSNGNDYIIKISQDGGTTFDDVIGQMEATMTSGGVPIDITNKSSGGYIEYLADVKVSKQITFAGTLVLFNNAVQNLIKTADENGTLLDLQIIAGVGGESWEGQFSAQGRSDSAPLNDKATMSINLMSSGTYDYTEPTV